MSRVWPRACVVSHSDAGFSCAVAHAGTKSAAAMSHRETRRQLRAVDVRMVSCMTVLRRCSVGRSTTRAVRPTAFTSITSLAISVRVLYHEGLTNATLSHEYATGVSSQRLPAD